MKYKVGDEVRIKSIEWYNANKDKDGVVPLTISSNSQYNFIRKMANFCGMVVTVMEVHEENGYYDIEADKGLYFWTDEMIVGASDNQDSKMVSLDRIVEYLDSKLYTTCDYFGNVQTASRDSINKKEFIEKLCKTMAD